MKRWLALAVALTLGVTGCSQDSASEVEGLQVVATTSVLADPVRELVGTAGSVETLMERGSDPHSFSPTPEQAASLRSADLVVANGLGLEAGISELLASAGEETTVLELATHLDPLPFGDPGGDGHTQEHAAGAERPGHGELDPHFTLDPLRMADAIDLVADALAGIDDTTDWAARAGEVRAELEQLHHDIEETLRAVPPQRRKLVTNHDALGYFAHRYGFEVVGTVIPGGSTLADPSASHLAELAEVLRREGVTAVFADTESPARLAETVAAEVGEEVEVHRLYTGSLGAEGSGAETYGDMMRTNADTIASALGS